MPLIHIDEGKSIEELEDMVVFFRIRIIEERTQLSELVKTERRLLKHFAEPITADSTLHGQLTHLQEQILEYQDNVMELDCGTKVLRKLTKQNLKKVKQQQHQRNQKRRQLLVGTKANDDSSSKSLLTSESPSILMASPAAA
mmetsp:Transcript_5428/g.8905  ORF Transcript_5428/g.8905 Transcript_5428/m.8905 type:complete len:142 (+) Transcript_5428:77-502(+)|eukprot:CAMPEP_0119007964 /NCGR_PEP_ID=MMETSP1176-20130426/3367_1 /TAXON_ID=265551 /ORGANISM="Synedropsis recta cf, Strain CCMP1620" /LENGTH=141 /DNA_ID=CAMNT_0006960203 /DNA_START=77 /DNA_END=502 /DNA_ORIENTATION=-